MNELYHYGVKGMKWGIRRYQNPDGSLTDEGRKRARKEYKQDNKEASELGYKGTVTSKASRIGDERLARATKRYNKALANDPDQLKKRTKRLHDNMVDSLSAAFNLKVSSLLANEIAKKHCQSLIDKYGNEAVKPIKYKDLKYSKSAREKYGTDYVRIMNEARKQDSFSALATLGSILGAQAMAQAAGFGVYSVFPNSNDEARTLADMAYYDARSIRKKQEKEK